MFITMRIEKVTIKNFRCFKNAEFDLSSDIVAIYGRNGTGKTSFFDSIEYALLGNIDRYGNQPVQQLKNVFSTEDIKIRIDFKNKVQEWLEINETPQGLELSGSQNWKSPRDFLYDFLVLPKYQTARRNVDSLGEILRSTVLLSQENIRYFVNGTPDRRERVLTYLAGDAQLQKCWSKTALVEKEIGSRKKEEESKLAMYEIMAKDFKTKIVELENKLKSFRDKIGSQSTPRTFTSLLETLKTVHILTNLNEPSTQDELESTINLIKTGCEEKYSEISKKNKILAEIETLSLSYDSKAKRNEQVTILIEKTQKDLEDLKKNEAFLKEKLDQQEKNLSRIGYLKEESIKTIESYQKILQLRIESDRLKNTINQIREKLEQLTNKQKDFFNFLKERGNERDSVSKECNNQKSSIEIEKKRLEKLITKRQLFSQYSKAKLEFDHVDSKRKEIDLKKEQITSSLATLIDGRKVLAEKIALLNNQIAEMGSNINETKSLIAKLKQFATGSLCLLCGHDHKSNKALQESIELQLETVPVTLQELFQRSQQLNNQNLILINNQSKLEGLLKSLDDQYGQLISFKASQMKIINDFVADLEAYGILVNEIAIEEAITASSSLISDRQSHLEKNQSRLENALIYEKNAKEQLNYVTQFIDTDTRALQENEANYNRIERDIQELFGNKVIENTEIPVVLEELKKKLASFEKQKGEIEVIYFASKQDVEVCRLEISKKIESLKKFEEEKTQLLSFIQEFKFKCEKLQIASHDSLSIEKIRLEIGTQQALINESLKKSDEYRWSKYSDLINEEFKGFNTQHEEAVNETLKAKNQISKLELSLVKVLKWKEILGLSISSSVERTINNYRPDIVRLFKAMIPFPYLFDGIEIYRGDSGVTLGLKYRDQQKPSGEPKFFLSSAQANVLALSIFLTLSSQQSWSRLKTIMLDDPVQHLDDLDAVAFLDGLRNIALGHFGTRNQVIIATCDLNLYLLMLRKFSLIEKSGVSFTAISIQNNGDDPEVRYDLRPGVIGKA